MTDVIGVGIDLVDVARFASVLERRPRMRTRLFRDNERSVLRPERLAARFAAKEAVMKALGVGLGAMSLRDIEIVNQSGGAATVLLHGRAAEIAMERGVRQWHLSLTHTELSAGAVVIATS